MITTIGVKRATYYYMRGQASSGGRARAVGIITTNRVKIPTPFYLTNTPPLVSPTIGMAIVYVPGVLRLHTVVFVKNGMIPVESAADSSIPERER